MDCEQRGSHHLAASGYDANYVERWTTELGLHNLWQQCKP